MNKVSNQGWIRVSRPDWLDGVTRSVFVWIDNAQTVRVWRGEVRGVKVDPGRHTARCESGQLTTNQIEVDLAPGESANFECRSHISGWRILIAPYFWLFHSKDILHLKRVEHLAKL
jgi:hypothetical protein